MMKEKVMDVLKNMDDCDLVNIWNEYCYATNRYDDEILDSCRMEEYIETCEDKMQLLNMFYFGSDDMNNNEYASANPNRDYFCFNGYGNIVSFDYIYNQYTDEFYHMDAEELVDYIVENEESFYNNDIQEVLNDEEE